MKLSQIPREEIPQLPLDQIQRIVYTGIYDWGENADVALVLGTTPEYDCKGRALWAAKMYLDGRVKHIIPSGGVEHEFPEGKFTEAEYMRKVMLEAGIPEEVIILENEARTTKENMVCGTFQITRKLLIQNVKSVMVVSSAVHLQRALAQAKLFLPRSIRISISPSADTPEGVNWWEVDHVRNNAIREAQLMGVMIRQGLMEELEF